MGKKVFDIINNKVEAGTKIVHQGIETVRTGIETGEQIIDDVKSIANEIKSFADDIRSFPKKIGSVDYWFPGKFNSFESLSSPVYLKAKNESQFWQLPFEPQISVKGSNNIAMRKVAKQKQRGTIKEYWTGDDYTITIKGVVVGKQYGAPDEDTIPYKEIENLKYYLEEEKELIVVCPALEAFNIQRIVIQSLDLPFTKFENAQAYIITAVSDNSWDLLIEDKKTKNIDSFSTQNITEAVKDWQTTWRP